MVPHRTLSLETCGFQDVRRASPTMMHRVLAGTNKYVCVYAFIAAGPARLECVLIVQHHDSKSERKKEVSVCSKSIMLA